MSYLVHCALIDLIDDLPDVDCSLMRFEEWMEAAPPPACRITTFDSWPEAWSCSSLPGNLIQETLALPIGKLTRSHWPKIEQEIAANFFSGANKSQWKGLLAVNHLQPFIQREGEGAQRGWLEREKPLAQIRIDSAIERRKADWWCAKVAFEKLSWNYFWNDAPWIVSTTVFQV